MVKLKNISQSTQCFTGFSAWPAGETRDFSKEDAAVLLQSPFIQEVTDDKPRSTKPLKAIEKDEK